jgi:hypothetical protein
VQLVTTTCLSSTSSSHSSSVLLAETEDSEDETSTSDWTTPLDSYHPDHSIHAELDAAVHCCQVQELACVKRHIQNDDFRRGILRASGSYYPSAPDTDEDIGLSQVSAAKYAVLLRKELGKQAKKRKREGRHSLRVKFAAQGSDAYDLSAHAQTGCATLTGGPAQADWQKFILDYTASDIDIPNSRTRGSVSDSTSFDLSSEAFLLCQGDCREATRLDSAATATSASSSDHASTQRFISGRGNTRKYLGICVPDSAKELILRHNDHDVLDKMRLLKERLLDDQEFAAIDSGSTINLTRESVPLLDFDSSISTTIMGFNGSRTRSIGAGTISGLTADEHGNDVSFRIPNAHIVKGAPNNLLSVSALVRQGFSFHFTPSKAWMETPQHKIVNLVEKSGLFWLRWSSASDSDPALPAHSPVFDPTPASCSHSFIDEQLYFESASEQLSSHTVTDQELSKDSSCQCYLVRGSGKTIDLELAHRRFGHIGEALLERMFDAGAIDLRLSGRKFSPCPICSANKVTRSTVPSTRERPQQVRLPFERIWSDVKGPIERDFWGHRYFVTFTCDRTRYTVVYAMRRKSQVLSMFKDFTVWVRLQGFEVRLLNSDGGGEYRSNDFVAYCRGHSISQQFTCPDTSAQNGISERLNRTLWEGVNCALNEAALSNAFWSLALKCVCWIKNRIWHTALSDEGSDVSPYELVYKRPPSFRMARVFGSDIWVLRDDIVKSRAEPKGDKCIFVGLPADQKGWLVYDPRKKKCRVTYNGFVDETFQGRYRALHDYFHTQHKLAPRDRLAHELESLFSDPDKAEPLPISVSQDESDAQQRQSGDRDAAQQEACTDGVLLPPISADTGAIIGDSDSDSESVAAKRPRRRSQEGGRRSSSSVVDQPAETLRNVPDHFSFGKLSLIISSIRKGKAWYHTARCRSTWSN